MLNCKKALKRAFNDVQQAMKKLVGTFYLTRLISIFAVLGTSSFETVLPRMMKKMENLGAKNHGEAGGRPVDGRPWH